MRAPNGPRAIRVGVLLGERLVEERVLPYGAPITFGQSLRCMLSIPGDGIPGEHVLFAPDDGRMQLRLTASMTGRLAQGDTVRTELHDGAGEGGVWTIALERGARGRLRIGDATVLFQEVSAPPLAPRPVLPASVRGTFADRIDRRLATIVGASILVHLGLAGYAWMQDVEDDSLFSPTIAQTYRHDTIDVTLPDEPPPAPSLEPGPGATTPVAPVQVAKPIVNRPRVATPARPTQAPGMSPDDAARFASVLTGADETPRGNGTMHDRTPGADLSKQIADVGDRDVRIGDTRTTFREQPGPHLGTDSGPKLDDPTQVTNTPAKHEGNPGRIVIRPVPGQPPIGTSLTAQMVIDKINSVYMPGLQRCYRKGMLSDGSLSGKVKVGFTVTERGGLDDISARGVTTEVDACIATQMQSWRFPIPRDQDGDADTQSFELALALQQS